MTGVEAPDRHLSAEGLAEYVAADVPVVLPIAGSPAVSIFIDPTHHRLGLRCPIGQDVAPPSSSLEYVRIDVVQHDGGRQLEVSSDQRELFADVYAMLCAIADRIQLEGQIPVTALDLTLDSWRRLLERRARLSDEQESGLYGELLVVRSLIETAGKKSALESWRGPKAEEHDFGFKTFDVEVKTTTGERRRHWIGGLTQLVPTLSRPLWLISIQLTGAGTGHGSTLAEVIDDLRSRISDGIEADAFEKTLEAIGWNERQRDLFTRRLQLRSAARAYPVDDRFPAITPSLMDSARFDPGSLVDVRYEIDVTNMASGTPPVPVAAALETLS